MSDCNRQVPTRRAVLCSLHAARVRRHGTPGPAEPRAPIEGCSIVGCGEEHKARGYCDIHYRRFMRTGDPLEVRRVANWKGELCRVEGCKDEVDSKHLCSRHYQRYRLYGDPLGGGPARVRTRDQFCSLDGCDREHYGLGFCALHYKRFKAHGNPLVVWPNRERLCSIADCGQRHCARGYCERHYATWVKHGDPMFKRTYPTICVIDGCAGSSEARGYCKKHYMRLRKWGDPYFTLRIRGSTGAPCTFEGCEGNIRSKGLCEKHYDRLRTHGDPAFSLWEIDMDVPTSLYRLFDETVQLLYVGVSVRVEQRLHEHSRDKWWWPEVEHQVITRCATRREALELEAEAIRLERPKYNVVHAVEI